MSILSDSPDNTKNQAKIIQQFLPSILEQKHSKFEIVLINNASSDNTKDVVELLNDGDVDFSESRLKT